MIVSQLIRQLQDALAYIGDVEVYYTDDIADSQGEQVDCVTIYTAEELYHEHDVNTPECWDMAKAIYLGP